MKAATQAQSLRNSERFLRAKQELLAAIEEATSQIQGPKPSVESLKSEYQEAIAQFQAQRGRDLYYPFLASGLGNGPWIELADGSVKWDMITGIGINFFGHGCGAYLSELIDALPSDVMQGNLQPGVEAPAVLAELLRHVGPRSRLKHAWLMCSGTMVNEVALKIVRQKKAPATKILAFKDCFAGRSTAMQEITDSPGYRVGQPVYGEVAYLSFYDPDLGLEKSLKRTLSELREHLARFPEKFAALMLELVQGEGGFNFAPREFYVGVFEEVKKAGLAIWVDEIQTFGRTGELFAYQTFDLNEWIDVVTIGKLSQACAVLYTAEYNPKPGLVAGTFSGGSGVLRTARRTLEMLTAPGVQGPEGAIVQRSKYFAQRLQALKDGSCRGLIGEIRAIGGMIGFSPLDGKAESVKKVLFELFDQGVVAFTAGHGPYFVRMLPPMMVMDNGQIEAVCALIEKALLAVAQRGGASQ